LPLDQRTLQELVEGTVAETGETFFAALVKHLALAIGKKCAWVTEWLPDQRRLRALSFWVGDGYFGDFEYAIADTPCAPVIDERRLFLVPEPRDARRGELYGRAAARYRWEHSRPFGDPR
jgi:hypothetical protein